MRVIVPAIKSIPSRPLLCGEMDIGFEANCPLCGQRITCTYGPEGMLKWWPQERHCGHFRGMYESGNSNAPEAMFR